MKQSQKIIRSNFSKIPFSVCAIVSSLIKMIIIITEWNKKRKEGRKKGQLKMKNPADVGCKRLHQKTCRDFDASQIERKRKILN